MASLKAGRCAGEACLESVSSDTPGAEQSDRYFLLAKEACLCHVILISPFWSHPSDCILLDSYSCSSSWNALSPTLDNLTWYAIVRGLVWAVSLLHTNTTPPPPKHTFQFPVVYTMYYNAVIPENQIGRLASELKMLKMPNLECRRVYYSAFPTRSFLSTTWFPL